MITKRSLCVLLLSTAFSIQAVAAEKIKEARPGDTVYKYGLTDKGVFYRLMPRSGQQSDGKNDNNDRCDITANVSDFTIARHASDKGMAYYIKNGDMWAVLSNPPYNGKCPKAVTTRGPLVSNVAKIGVVSAPTSKVVAYALDKEGRLSLRGDAGEVNSFSNVDEVGETGCYGAKNRSFSGKILLIHQTDGTVVTMEDDGSYKTRKESTYESLATFKKSQHICELNGAQKVATSDAGSQGAQ